MEERSVEYGRAVLVADAAGHPRRDPRADRAALWLDARVLWIKGSEIRVRGTELVDGVEYAQAWVAKVLPC